MTTRVQAWLRQADSDIAVGQLTEASGSSNQEAAGAALGAAVGNLLNNLFK